MRFVFWSHRKQSPGLLKLVSNTFSKTTYTMKIFDRRGLILKFDTMRNQSVPILVSNLSNKPITNLQIANPFSQTRVSCCKVLALQKDCVCRTFLLWFLSLVWTNYRRRWSAVSQPTSGELSPSFNVTLEINPQATNVIYIYIYGAPSLDVSRSHTTTHHSR